MKNVLRNLHMYACLVCLVKFFCSFLSFMYFSLPLWWIKTNILRFKRTRRERRADARGLHYAYLYRRGPHNN